LEKLNDIHGENTPGKQHMDASFIAYIKGEDTKTAAHSCISEIVENWRPFKKQPKSSTTRRPRKARKTHQLETRSMGLKCGHRQLKN